MDGQVLVSANGTALVNGLANNVDDSAERLGANRHLDGIARVVHWLPAHQTLGGVQSDRAHVVATQMLGDLEHEAVLGAFHLKCIHDGGQFTLELNVHDGANDLGNLPFGRAENA